VKVQPTLPHVRLNIGQRVRPFDDRHDLDPFMVPQKPPTAPSMLRDADNSDLGNINASRRRDGRQEVFSHVVGIAVEGGLRRVKRHHRLYLFRVEANEAGLAPAAQLRRAACF